MRLHIFGVVVACFCLCSASRALAWGDEGHEIVALIAQHYLSPGTKTKIATLLSEDSTNLTQHDIASAATWADKYRDSDRFKSKVRYNQTHYWHFADIEIDGGDLNTACFGHPPVPSGTPASKGPAQDCVTDKVEEFVAELANTSTPAAERVMALEFLLHFVGDMHQPLHMSDDNDQGGNGKKVKAPGDRSGNLHHYWDTDFVEAIDIDPVTAANDILKTITTAQRQEWTQGTSDNWAIETSDVGKTVAYNLPTEVNSHGAIVLSADYKTAAIDAVRIQLARAGVRLALLLTRALGK